jgi:hypothetical protein
MLKARARFQGINLDERNPQLAALRRVLGVLADAGQRTVVFYATENPEALDELVNIERHQAQQVELESLISAYGKNLIYVGPQEAPDQRYFLDHVHVDRDGYVLLVDDIWPAVSASIE